MVDYEIGYRFPATMEPAWDNLYYMDYNNQMVQTGRLNDVGYKLMENVKESYRQVWKLETSVRWPARRLRRANITLSRNRISKLYRLLRPVHDTAENY
jgi:iron complex outermembrane receptor protein